MSRDLRRSAWKRARVCLFRRSGSCMCPWPTGTVMAFALEDGGRTSVEGFQMGGEHHKPATVESATFTDSIPRVPVRTVHLLSPLIVWYNVLIIPQTPPRQVVLNAFTPATAKERGASTGKHRTCRDARRAARPDVLGTTAVRELVLGNLPVVQPHTESNQTSDHTAYQTLHCVRVRWYRDFRFSRGSNRR